MMDDSEATRAGEVGEKEQGVGAEDKTVVRRVVDLVVFGLRDSLLELLDCTSQVALIAHTGLLS